MILKHTLIAFLLAPLATLHAADSLPTFSWDHVPVYAHVGKQSDDFTPEQFVEMDALRYDIYQLREYLRFAGLPYSVAHPAYSVNGKLTLAVIEKLLLLFDVFETVNGARVAAYNDLFKKILLSLTPERIAALEKKHLIEPLGPDSWRKSFTGGSDEHAGLFIGETFTLSEGSGKKAFLAALRGKATDSGGRSNHYKTQVYTFLKIVYQYSLSRTDVARRGASRTFRAKIGRTSGRPAVRRAWDELCGAIFDGKSLGWKTQLKMEQLKRTRRGNVRLIASQVSALMHKLVHHPRMPHRERIDLIYETVAGIEDAFFISNVDAFQAGFARGDVLQLISSITAVFRSFFLSLPFLGTFRHLHQSSMIMAELRVEFLGPLPAREKKILWFTDTLDDLNGVSATLNGFSAEAMAGEFQMKLVTVQSPDGCSSVSRLRLPAVYEYKPEFYPGYVLRFPSLLKSLDMIYDEAPTEIVISTPGPAGLVGMLAARLFGIPCRGVYHSDFARMVELGLSGGTAASCVAGYVRWFYTRMDEILVPTRQAITTLAARGYDLRRLRLFARGIDQDFFAPVPGGKELFCERCKLDGFFTLLYAGRISRDKSLGFLARVYSELVKRVGEVNFIFAGDGPMVTELKEKFSASSRVYFTGRLGVEDMPLLYSAADLLVFPSTMDTFGMSVLEAQSCELPALVSNVGGPQEVIEPGVTGWVAPADNAGAWVEAMLRVREMWLNAGDYNEIRRAARLRVKKLFSWEAALRELYKDE